MLAAISPATSKVQPPTSPYLLPPVANVNASELPALCEIKLLCSERKKVCHHGRWKRSRSSVFLSREANIMYTWHLSKVFPCPLRMSSRVWRSSERRTLLRFSWMHASHSNVLRRPKVIFNLLSIFIFHRIPCPSFSLINIYRRSLRLSNIWNRCIEIREKVLKRSLHFRQQNIFYTPSIRSWYPINRSLPVNMNWSVQFGCISPLLICTLHLSIRLVSI